MAWPMLQKSSRSTETIAALLLYRWMAGQVHSVTQLFGRATKRAVFGSTSGFISPLTSDPAYRANLIFLLIWTAFLAVKTLWLISVIFNGKPLAPCN